MRNAPSKFYQEAKNRVVGLVEDRILAKNMSIQDAYQAVATKLGVFVTRQDSGQRRSPAPAAPPARLINKLYWNAPVVKESRRRLWSDASLRGHN